MSQIKDTIVGLEFSTTALSAVKLDSDGRIADSHKAPINPSDSEAIPQVVDFIRQLSDKFGKFESMGIAVPGLFDRKTNRIALSLYNPEHANIDLAGELKKETGINAVLENDANAAAYAEYKLGAGRGSKDMFYVMLGAGVGGAIIFDSEIWRGASGFAGEFGHITINSEGVKLEDMASAANIVRRTRNRFHQDSTSSLIKIGEENITITDILREAKKEDDFAMMMLERTGMFVGIGVASVINLLNIETIVVGGQIMEAGTIVIDAIREKARELSFAPCFETTKLCAGELGEFAAATGAALLSQS